MGTKPPQCNRCNGIAQIFGDKQKPEKVVCSVCGESESYAEFRRSVGAQMFEFADEAISKPLREWAKRDKNVHYKPGRRPRRARGKFRVNL